MKSLMSVEASRLVSKSVLLGAFFVGFTAAYANNDDRGGIVPYIYLNYGQTDISLGEGDGEKDDSGDVLIVRGGGHFGGADGIHALEGRIGYQLDEDSETEIDTLSAIHYRARLSGRALSAELLAGVAAVQVSAEGLVTDPSFGPSYGAAVGLNLLRDLWVSAEYMIYSEEDDEVPEVISTTVGLRYVF
ncbi:hypothetical protein HH1059_25230 [Halorhodospira halochloris]|uniref:Outer membrane protein beta-barrel domain-containing protein n=1 Tax=Halorhodospira halochloris TaxID=1052 RepID=A0A0X8X6P6_HALHR|nr:outer membrane beta-barrel protein [Halorhodospira halochloris]MBK1650897.1 hypothetical protein [Halorhodospira halochloris]BAU56600.1 hypothetical protein HH1059_25230 [Halorhodospira halochloris]